MRHFRVDHISILQPELSMRRSRVVPGKYGMSSLMLALKKAEIKAEVIPLHMQQRNIETQWLKDKNETPKLMVNAGQINKTTTLPIPTE